MIPMVFITKLLLLWLLLLPLTFINYIRILKIFNVFNIIQCYVHNRCSQWLVFDLDGSIQVVKAVPGSAVSEKTFVLSGTGSNVALSGSEIRLVQPLTSTGPAPPGQKMVMFKAANSDGQVIHFLPLSQIKALNPNIVLNPQQCKCAKYFICSTITLRFF